jgi:N-acetylglucosaminyldiphosphoundecaprenol N-acetyl-beta-D-mannosaminyltransferase
MRSNEDERIDVCGLRFSKIGMTDLLSAIEHGMETRRLRLSLAATDSVVLATRDSRLRQILNSFDYLLADGVPIVWAARFLGTPLPERVAGPELFLLLLDLCRRKGYSAFFFGSDEETVRLVRRRISPDVRIAGHLCPEIHQTLDASESGRIISEINRAEPDFLFVVLGAPKQDRWIHDNRDALRAKVIVPIGAAFDWYAGRFVRAPKWMQRCGLEWVGRLAQNPRRLWRRYARDLLFPFLVFRHWARSPTKDAETPSAPTSVC